MQPKVCDCIDCACSGHKICNSTSRAFRRSVLLKEVNMDVCFEVINPNQPKTTNKNKHHFYVMNSSASAFMATDEQRCFIPPPTVLECQSTRTLIKYECQDVNVSVNTQSMSGDPPTWLWQNIFSAWPSLKHFGYLVLIAAEVTYGILH